jgi:hypothetical protein
MPIKVSFKDNMRFFMIKNVELKKRKYSLELAGTR